MPYLHFKQGTQAPNASLHPSSGCGLCFLKTACLRSCPSRQRNAKNRQSSVEWRKNNVWFGGGDGGEGLVYLEALEGRDGGRNKKRQSLGLRESRLEK